MIFAPALLALAAGASPLPAVDPRPAIVELHLAGRSRSALERTDRALAEEPARAREIGLEILRGALLERVGRDREAVETYAQALAANAVLTPWARLRLARLQERLGHPEVAAGLIATLLAGGAPEPLVGPSLDLLQRSLAAGGDCRLLAGVRRERLPADHRRVRDLAQAECWLREGRRGEAAGSLRELLEAEAEDAVAWEAASLLSRLPEAEEPAVARLVGFAAYHHREFEAAMRFLALGRTGGARWFDPSGRDGSYAVARSLFWLGRYDDAARDFAHLAQAPGPTALRADAFCQLARSLELDGRSGDARIAFQRSFELDPTGEWAGTALMGAIRIALAAGDDTSARADLVRLAARPGQESATARAALLVALSDLMLGRSQRVAAQLDLAARTRQAADEEIAYWRGRLAEVNGDWPTAVTRYLEVLERRPFHPLALSARRRLSAPVLAAEARRRGEELAERDDLRSLHRAVLLLGEADALGRRARHRGVELLLARRDTAPWVDWSPVPVPDWPLWQDLRDRPEDALVALGLLDDPGAAISRHFPTADVRLAGTGASALTRSEHGVRRGISLAESLFERRPREVPLEWVAPALLQSLYPFPWAPQIRAQASAFGVDPNLLAGLIREESRFDPRALSPASARGLTQFTLPTAQRLARDAGLISVAASDLYRPEVAIPLGAVYLVQLGRRFPKAEPIVVASYNAGEDQAALWRRNCVTAEPEEYLTRIGFRETKAYVVRVLESRALYAALYGHPSR